MISYINQENTLLNCIVHNVDVVDSIGFFTNVNYDKVFFTV